MEKLTLDAKHNLIARFISKNYSKDQVQQNIAIPMSFTKKARLFKSSALQLFTMISKF
jgi:hypothetical protein